MKYGSSGLDQATTSPVIWQDFLSYAEAHLLRAELKKRCKKVGGGAMTYLQLINMMNICFTDSTDLLPQIQEFQENYMRILSNSHSRLSEDLIMFMFCSCLPESYEPTAYQYLDNVMDIAMYKRPDIITQVLQEESRRQAHSMETGLSLNKFSMVKNLGQKMC